MRIHLVLLSAGLALGLTGCVGGHSPDARFFHLQPASDVTPLSAPLDPAYFIVVKPVALESYLRQPQIADRVSTYEVTYGEFSRWAEPLDRNITRVVTENLRRILRTDRIAVVPQAVQGEKIITVMLEVKQFERQPDGHTALSAAWLLQSEQEGGAVRTGTADLKAPVAAGAPTEEAVAVQSRLLADLSGRIAADLEGMVKAWATQPPGKAPDS
jgi:hypothetical protein